MAGTLTLVGWIFPTTSRWKKSHGKKGDFPLLCLFNRGYEQCVALAVAKKNRCTVVKTLFSMWQEMFEQMDEDGDGEVTRHLDQGNVMEMTNTSLDDYSRASNAAPFAPFCS